MEWISVKDELPKYHEPCILCMQEGDYFVKAKQWLFGYADRVGLGCRIKSVQYEYEKKEIWQIDGQESNKITHWMPLPKPPKK